MASGRPDFHPTMLLEGKHDTELIPVLVDENGQLYIVMTGQQISVANLPSDYFKAGQAIGESAVGVVNLPSDYYKAGQAVGSVTANVNVAQTEKDRDMIGLDTSTRRQIAVDAAGIILARLKGAYGATLKDIAVDDVGILLSRLKGAYGGVLKDVSLDESGVLLSRLKGVSAGLLKDINVDSEGRIIAMLHGYYVGNPMAVALDSSGHTITRMKGYDGTSLQDVKVDASGYMLAKMTGIEGANLRTVAVDANGVMKANLSAQDLSYLKVRPVYGSGVKASVAAKECPNNVETTVLEITGKGATYGGLLYTASAGVLNLQGLRLYIDDAEFFKQDYSVMVAWNSYIPDHLPIFLIRDDPTTNHWGWGIKPGITFESKFKLTWHQTSGSSMYLYMDLFYALVP